MRKKLAIIFALAVLFAAVLVLRPWESRSQDVPRFFDRLPDADLIGKANILELSEALEVTNYHLKVPFREFLTREFILQQGKSFGIDIQKPAFFFANESEWGVEDFGIMLQVRDSSLVRTGMERLSRFVKIKDTVVYQRKVHKHANADLFFAHGKDWLLIYHGKKFTRTFHDVVFAKRYEIAPNWRDFLNKAQYSGSPIIAHVTTSNLNDYGISSVDLRLSNDSSSITLIGEVHQSDSIGIRLKDQGPVFEQQEYTRTLANLHLDVSGLRNNPDDPIVRLLKYLAAKVSFPVNDFLMAWEGDVAFRQGGLQSYREKFIESELDEDFNVTEVVKYKTIKVPGYSAYFTMNPSYPDFINRLMIKGILTYPDKRYRILFSPPVEMEQEKQSVAFHTASYYEKPEEGSGNRILFTHDKTRYTFQLDSIHPHTYYCRFNIPLRHFIPENDPSNEF